ncbi:hypothetical protein MVEN_02107500 [Mycena venus]|uniref:Uncharacterized protein n=1 Tax=Mycena venus TaxID=2733690 RepID=A0A8H6XA09_9AGAR|nr:hypothetical protein MVEN_02107500 [Mycena venus]
MDIQASTAVNNFLSAPLHQRFPLVTDSSWDTALSCSEHDLDHKRSCGFLALHSYLEQSLVRAAGRQQDPPNLELLRELLLSDDILTRLLARAGICAGQDSEQASKAFLVFVEMVITDHGIKEFASWFSQTFEPIVSVAFEACRGWSYSEPATTLSVKRLVPFHNDAASKRQRTSIDSGRLIYAILRQLRLKQVLSTWDEPPHEIQVALGTQTDQDPHPATPSPVTVWSALVLPTPSAAHISRAPSCDATTIIPDLLSLALSDSQRSTISKSPDFQTSAAVPMDVHDDDSGVTTDLEQAAIIFIMETIDMVIRGELLPTAPATMPPPLSAVPPPPVARKSEHNHSSAEKFRHGRPGHHANNIGVKAKRVRTKRKAHPPFTEGRLANIPRSYEKIPSVW